MNAAEAHHTLATIGVVPSRPETGYGYIQAKKEAGPISGARQGYPVYDVTAFHEKPNRDKAQDFVEAGNYYWNSGMFFWRVSVFLGELEQARPEFAKKARDIAEAIKASDYPQARKIFESLEDISVDYALMEHAKRVIVAEAAFDWDDVGAWPALDRSLPKDADGNVTAGQPVVIDSEDCIVYNAAGPDAMSVAVVGARDLVVVTTDDAVLVLPKDRAQDVKAAVKELKQRNSPHV
jgi:mannose-1-phosphate guanylyltransferase